MELCYAITGNIDPNTLTQLVNTVNSQLCTNNVGILKVLISSGGGDVDTAINIYSYLKNVPIEVETIGFGQIDSAAILIFLAGKRRYAVKDTRFFLHEISLNVQRQGVHLTAIEESRTILGE